MGFEREHLPKVGVLSDAPSENHLYTTLYLEVLKLSLSMMVINKLAHLSIYICLAWSLGNTCRVGIHVGLPYILENCDNPWFRGLGSHAGKFDRVSYPVFFGRESWQPYASENEALCAPFCGAFSLTCSLFPFRIATNTAKKLKEKGNYWYTVTWYTVIDMQ